MGLFGGGDGDKYAKKAFKAEQERIRRQNQAIDAINAIFGVRTSLSGNDPGDLSGTVEAREGLFDDIRGSTFDYFKDQLDEQNVDARRNLRFNLARSGLAGGSTELDEQSNLLETYNQGVLDIGSRADDTRNRAMAADEQNRIDLISRIRAGLDTGSAIANANTSLRRSIDEASANARSQALGDVFGNVSSALQYRALGQPQESYYGNRRAGRYAPSEFFGTVRK